MADRDGALWGSLSRATEMVGLLYLFRQICISVRGNRDDDFYQLSQRMSSVLATYMLLYLGQQSLGEVDRALSLMTEKENEREITEIDFPSVRFSTL